ncbi:MAG: redoxin domain-containing protein [Chloroflexia bacterium]|nr:redoxin domain-containing protein [Chloroflexia bacterium]
MRDNIDRIRAADAEPFGVNPGDAASHQEFIAAHNFPFELLVDDGLGVARAYGALKPDGSGTTRTVVIVGKDGRVIFRQAGAPAWALMNNAIQSADDEAG